MVEQSSETSIETPIERAPSGVLLVEVAWEVCNQVGGIYQVLRSKAPTMAQRWGTRFCMVGPYVPAAASAEFEQLRPSGWVARVVADLEEHGIVAHHGRWLVAERPRTFLLEHENIRGPRLEEAKQRLLRDLGLAIAPGDDLVDSVVAFGEAVRLLLEALCKHCVRPASEGGRRVLAHTHEWMAGVGMLLVAKQQLPLDTVFTTHATVLGRAIAYNETDFYDRLDSIDPNVAATRYGVVNRHGIERACAQTCNVFTTVSPITGEECRQLLGRRPDLITPNGLNVDRYDVGHDFQTLHAEYKERIHRFALGHFFPSYSFELDKTLYFFTSGRFEPKNKGFDLCLETMARLNLEIINAKLDVTVVFFIISQVPVHSIQARAIESRAMLEELKSVSHHIADAFEERLFRAGAAGSMVKTDALIDEYWRIRFRRTQQAFRSQQLPPTVTHVLVDDAGDPVAAHIRYLGFKNTAVDRVKIIYHPQFITPVNPLWGIEYDQFVRGCHLGIFPSAYEPWGYTPLECVAMGVPAVTSDLAGFGRYVADRYASPQSWGLTVLRRRGLGFHDGASVLTRHLLDYCRLSRKGRVALRNEVVHRSRDFDWSKLAEPYHRAHSMALRTHS